MKIKDLCREKLTITPITVKYKQNN